MSETFRRSEGTFGIKASEVGWGARGILEQKNDCGGDWKTNSGDEGLLQSLELQKMTSDSSEEVGLEGAVSIGVEVVGDSSSYMHFLWKVRHGVHGLPASHLYPHNPRSVPSRSTRVGQ